jgi:hypothetical protein
VGTEAQRLLDVSLGILGLPEEKLADAYRCVRASRISIQLQRRLALPDSLRGAVGIDLDQAQTRWASAFSGAMDSALVKAASAAASRSAVSAVDHPAGEQERRKFPRMDTWSTRVLTAPSSRTQITPKL